MERRIHKSGVHKLAGNYHPISLLPFFKILEKYISNWLTLQLGNSTFMAKRQHRFLKRKPITTNLLDFTKFSIKGCPKDFNSANHGTFPCRSFLFNRFSFDGWISVPSLVYHNVLFYYSYFLFTTFPLSPWSLVFFMPMSNLNTLFGWCSVKKLALKPSKCHSMCYSLKFLFTFFPTLLRLPFIISELHARPSPSFSKTGSASAKTAWKSAIALPECLA